MASPYPPVLAKTWASLVADALAARDLALARGEEVPFADPLLGQEFPLPVPQELSALAPQQSSSISTAMAVSSRSSPACTWQASSTSASTGCTTAAVSG